jgi:hypothetical protein
VSVEGVVEFSRSGTAIWTQADPGDVLCDGDSVRTGDFSRAALRLPDDTVLRIAANGAGRWTATRNEDRSFW